MTNYGEASCRLRCCSVLRLSRSRWVSERSESRCCWCASLLSLSYCRLSLLSTQPSSLPLHPFSGLPSSSIASEESFIMSTRVRKRDTCWRIRKLCVKPVYFNRKPVTDRHTSTNSDQDPTSARRACTIMYLTLRRSAIILLMAKEAGVPYKSIKYDLCILKAKYKNLANEFTTTMILS